SGGEKRLLHPPSPAVVGQDPGTWSAPASRATLSRTRHVAALASTSPPRAISGESEAQHHLQTTADSLAGADSIGFGDSTDSDSESFSHETSAVDLRRTGLGDSRQRRIPLCQRASATAQKAKVRP